MSSGAEGIILLLPLLILGALPALAIATGVAAGIAVDQTGRSMVACGQELARLSAENLALTRGFMNAARQYENELLGRLTRADATAERQAAEETRRLRAAQDSTLARLQAERELVTVPTLDESAFERARAAVLATTPPAASRQVSPASWPTQLRQVAAYYDAIAERLAAFERAPLAALFDVSFVRQELARAAALLSTLQDQSARAVADGQVAAEDLAALTEVRATLAWIDRRLGEYILLAPARREERAAAKAALTAADAKLRTLPADADVDALAIAARTLQDGLGAFDSRAFAKAQRLAARVTDQVETLGGAIAEQRQRNLALLIGGLRARLEPLTQLTAVDGVDIRGRQLGADAVAWVAASETVERTAQIDVAAAWLLVEGPAGLAERAQHLLTEAQELTRTAVVDGLERLSSEAMTEAGLTGIVTETRADGGRTLRGRAAEGGRFDLRINSSGWMSMDAHGFAGPACDAMTTAVLKALESRGVVGRWQQRYTLSAAVDRLALMLQRAGLAVRIEPSKEGATLVASGRVAGAHQRITGGVDFDGKLTGDLAARWRQLVRDGDAGADWSARQEELALADVERERRERQDDAERQRLRIRAN